MSGSNPVPLPPVEPSGAARAASKPKWLVPVIAGGAAVVVLAAGGIGGYLYWNHNQLTAASGECATSYDKAVKAVNDSIKAKADADAKAEKEEQAAENTAQAPDNGSSYTGDTTGGHTGYTGGGYTQPQGGNGGYTYTPQQPTGNGGGYAPAPQPAPQPTPQPPQGNNGGGSGGDDDYEYICGVYPTDGSPSYQVPCS